MLPIMHFTLWPCVLPCRLCDLVLMNAVIQSSRELLWLRVTAKWYFDNHFVTFYSKSHFSPVKTGQFIVHTPENFAFSLCLKNTEMLFIFCSWVWFVSFSRDGSIFMGKQLAFIFVLETRALTDNTHTHTQAHTS